MRKTIQRLALVALTMLSTAMASAVDFTVGNLTYTVIDETTNVKVKAATKSISGDVVIPETISDGTTTYSVTEIEDEAFHSCHSLTSVFVPNSVTTLGRAAFANSSKLTEVTIGSGVTSLACNGSLTYGGTFENCYRLERVIFAEGDTGSHLTRIENWSFYRCSALQEIVFPSTITEIGHRVFVNCSDLRRIVLPVSSVPSLIDPSDDPFNNFPHKDLLLVEVPMDVLSDFETAEIWNTLKYMMHLTDTNVCNLSLKSVFGTVNQSEIDDFNQLFITHANSQQAYWYVNNTQTQNVSLVLNACSYKDYIRNTLNLSIYSIAEDGTETLHETMPIALYNPDNTEQ